MAKVARSRREEEAHAGTPALGRRRVDERVGPGENGALPLMAFSPDPILSSTHRATRGASIGLFAGDSTLLGVVFEGFVPSC